MRKFLLLLCTLLATVGAMAQVVSTWDSELTSSLVTKDALVASAGSGNRYAFRMPSSSKPGWCDLVNEASSTANALTTDAVFSIEAGSTAGTYWLKRYDGQYLSGNATFGSTGIDLTLTDRVPSNVNDYDTGFSDSSPFVSFDNSTGNHYNCGNASGGLQFRGGTGGWSVYAAVGPLYAITVKCVDADNTAIQPDVTHFVKGSATIAAPAVSGYTIQGTGSAAVSGNADETVTFTYNALPAFDPNNVAGKTFTMQCARGYVYYNGTQLAGTSTAANASKFAIVAYNSNTYLYDVTNNAFVCHTTAATAGTTGNAALESNSDFSKIAKNISFGNTNIAAYPYYVQEDEFTNWLNMDGGPKVYLNRWTNFENGNGGNTYKIEIVDIDFDQTAAANMLDEYFNPSATVTYVISDANGEVFNSGALPATVGETITSLPADYQRAFCTYSAIDKTIIAGANTINVTVTYDLPFEVGTGKLYFATLRGHYVYYNDTNTDVRTNQTSKENTNAYKWSFYGTPYSGIKVKNEATGTYLDNTANSVQLTADGYAWTIHRLNSTSTFGLYNGTNHINEQNHTNHNLIYWWAFETDAGSQWNVEEVPDVTVTVTFNLLVDNQIVNTVEQNDVAANTTISVPASLTANYSTLGYDFAGNGDVNVGTTDLTVNVTATLKAGVVTALDNLSNAKAYTLSTDRGDLYIKTDHLASNSNANVGATAGSFALISYENNYYLYSVDASKFVLGDGSLSATPTSDIATVAITAQSIKPLFLMVLGGKGLNVTNTSDDFELAINTYVTPDPGNRYCIAEASVFDPTDALAALEAHFHPSNFYDRVEAQVLPYLQDAAGDPSPTIGKPFGLSTTAATSIVTTYMNQLNNQQFTQEEYEAIVAAKDAGIIYPADGFYHVKNVVSGKYLRATKLGGYGASEGAAMADGEGNDVAAIVEIRTIGGAQYALSNGAFFNWALWSPYYPIVSAGKDRAIEFKAMAPGEGAFALYYNKTSYPEDSFYGVVSSSNFQVVGMASSDEKAQWTFEEVTNFTSSISDAGYATFYVPFPVTIPDGVTAYTATTDGVSLTMTKVETTIPAGTAVILEGNANDYTFEIAAGNTDAAITSDLVGNYFASTVPAGANNYVLQKQTDSGKVGFFLVADNDKAIKANRAYLNVPSSTPVKAFYFEDATDAIQNVFEGISNGEIYNLAGQRIGKLQKGVNIVNGKKVMVK